MAYCGIVYCQHKESDILLLKPRTGDIPKTTVCRTIIIHISHQSRGKGSQGNPIRPIGDYQRLLGLVRTCCGDLAPLAFALMAYMFLRARILKRGGKGRDFGAS